MRLQAGSTATVLSSTLTNSGNKADKEAVAKRKASLSASADASNVEQWAVNKAVHYNEWANFGKKDFQPVVSAFKQLLESFRCQQCEKTGYTLRHG